jgi:hypothetical protein
MSGFDPLCLHQRKHEHRRPRNYLRAFWARSSAVELSSDTRKVDWFNSIRAYQNNAGRLLVTSWSHKPCPLRFNSESCIQEEKMNEDHHSSDSTYVVRSSLVEHLAVNQDCVGSIPIAPPAYFTPPEMCSGVEEVRASVAQWYERSVEAGSVGGSIPSRGTKRKR